LNSFTWEYADLSRQRWCRVTLAPDVTAGWSCTVALTDGARSQVAEFPAIRPSSVMGRPLSLEPVRALLRDASLPELPRAAFDAIQHLAG
jgi:hypothetical protein